MRFRYTESDILLMADYIVENNATLFEAERDLGFPHASIHWNIHHKLDRIDHNLAESCKSIVSRHRKHKSYKARSVCSGKNN